MRRGIITKLTKTFGDAFGSKSSKKKLTVSEQWFKHIIKGDKAALKKQLKNGFHINTKNERGRSALMIATYNRDEQMVAYLIAEKADVNCQDDRMNSPFLYAAAEGYLEMVKLMSPTADVKRVNRYGGIGIIPASEKAYYDTVKWLLEETKSDVNHVNNLGWTALLEAVILGDGSEKYERVIRLLLLHGASKDIADRDGMTAIEHAEKLGYERIVNVLNQ
ncbi:ankyrin repeat domain-containing protein [Kurthia sibirica]|uniref:Uncharacterized protein n=1 Tax=Kurthia sibirica TaxID=202750 RepID=A0A2U3AQ81_9BACL|nr:ankyrin repeat domain-containing protein [Kurthia sibirica]PWI26687.1 hypothetical protein DEX24_02715 [Kurthia sibirica]